MHVKLNFVFDAVSKTAVISLVSFNFTIKQYHNVQLELLQQHIKLHPDQFKSMRENKATRNSFPLILWPRDKVKVTVTGI